jgi:hypothetical protein
MSAFLGEIEISNTFPVLDIDKSDVRYVPSWEGLASFSCFPFLHWLPSVFHSHCLLLFSYLALYLPPSIFLRALPQARIVVGRYTIKMKDMKLMLSMLIWDNIREQICMYFFFQQRVSFPPIGSASHFQQGTTTSLSFLPSVALLT